MNPDLIYHIFFPIGNTLLMITVSFFAYQMVKLFLNVKPRLWAHLLVYVASALLTSMVIYIGDIVNLLPSVIFFLWAIWFCCSENGLHKLAIGMIFSTFAFAFSALHDNYIAAYFSRNSWESLLYYLSRFIFWLIMYVLLRRYAPEKDQELPPAMWKLMIALTLTPFGIVLSVVLLSTPYTESISGARITFFALLLIALLSVIGLFGILRILIRQQYLERQRILTETNQRYYESMEEQQFEVRRLKHDMSNQLNTIAALSDTQREEYIQELLHTPVFTQKMVYCSDSTVNAILTAKASVMQSENIPFQFHVDIARELPMSKPDICAIFANSLDNAIEACRLLPESQRKLMLETHFQKGLFVLKLVNSCDNSEAIPTPGGIRERFTTKQNKTFHGYGLHSIHETVQRYHGHLDVKKEQGTFTLFLYVPSEGDR